MTLISDTDITCQNDRLPALHCTGSCTGKCNGKRTQRPKWWDWRANVRMVEIGPQEGRTTQVCSKNQVCPPEMVDQTNLLLPYNPLLCCFSPLSWAVAGLKILLTPGPATATVDLLVVSRHRQQQSESGNFFQYTPPSAIISCLLRQIYVQCFVHFENMYNFDICFNIFQKSPNFETFS